MGEPALRIEEISTVIVDSLRKVYNENRIWAVTCLTGRENTLSSFQDKLIRLTIRTLIVKKAARNRADVLSDENEIPLLVRSAIRYLKAEYKLYNTEFTLAMRPKEKRYRQELISRLKQSLIAKQQETVKVLLGHTHCE